MYFQRVMRRHCAAGAAAAGAIGNVSLVEPTFERLRQASCW